MMHYVKVIKNALSAGHTVSVFDGEEWQVKRSADYKAILDAAQSVDMATLRIRNKAGERVGDVEIIGYHSEAAANADGYDDSVVDYSANPETEALIEE